MAVVELSKMYEIKDRQDAGGQNILNVYHVQRDNAAITAGLIATAYVDTVLAPLRVIQPLTVNHSIIEVENLGDPLDFASLSVDPTAGTRAGSNFATFYAATIQFNRTRTDMKNGQKRFVAGVEEDAAGSFWDAAFLSDVDDVKDGILSVWERAAAPGVDVCRYAIIKRVCTVDPPPDPCPSYRLPEDDDELVFYLPISGVSRDTVRSQVSRKRLV